MKITISLPQPLSRAADRIARQLNISRSQFYARAVAEYLEPGARANVKEALDRVYAKQVAALDSVLAAIQAASVKPEEW